MCGIVGARHDWLLARGLDPAAAMRAATATLQWRGPDGLGVVSAGPWWLGCARLAITQPRSHQPVVRRTGRFVGVLNGAVTNARALWATLLPRAERRAAPPNDAWLPLLAVARDALGSLRELRGHHAYAVVDTATGNLVFGQDRYGEKPLLCVVDRLAGRPQLVAFASMRAAMAPFGLPPTVEPRRLAELFRFGWAPIRSVRCSARLRIEPMPRRGEPLQTPANGDDWWQAATAPSSPVLPAPPAPSLREALRDSVARCLDTSRGTGLALSGGLDSSCLAATLGELGQRVPAYQLRCVGSPPHERQAATAVAMRHDLPLRPIDVGPELADELVVLTALAGQPLGDPSILALYAIARAAAADGVRVLLGGEGADELLLGYRRYRALHRLPHLGWLGRRASQWSMGYPARWLRAASAQDPVGALLAVTPPAFGAAVLAEPLHHRRCWRDAGLGDWPATAGPTPHRPDLALAARDFDLRHYLRADLLAKADIGSLAAGVEMRLPYLEGDVARFGLGLSALGKRPLRDAFTAELPPEVLHLGKRGLSLPLDAWFRGDLPWLDLLAEERTRCRPHLRPGGVSAAVDRHRRRQADLGHGLYLLVAIELFLRTLERGIPTGQRSETGPGA
ncbi:MAG: hypothetical protein JNL12_17250 [Planctomycetes bacterium]|nr:hypothetical protein [Planctomycetota bacterium]